MRFFCALSMTREPLVQHAQAVHGVCAWSLHRLADAVGHRIEPLVDRARHLGLAAGQRLAHRVDAAGGLGLDARDLAEALLEFVGAHGALRQRRSARRAERAHEGDGQQTSATSSAATADQRRRRRGRRRSPIDEKDLVHAPCSRFA